MPDAHGATRPDADRGPEGEARVTGLARDLGDLAREMRADQSMESLLRRIASAAVFEIDGARQAGISEIQGDAVHTRAATSDSVERIDEAQYRLGEGPCLTALREHVTVRSDDLTNEPRWPGFARSAVAEGVRSMLSVQLFVHDANLGALNLYGTHVEAFTENDENIATLLAAHAAVAMQAARSENNLRQAVESRDVIGQAKGILMERYKIGPAEAFDLLVMSSQRTHTKLRDVADELTATGELRVSQ